MSRFLTCFDRFADRYLPLGLSDVTILRIRALARLSVIAKDAVSDIDGETPSVAFLARGATKLVAHTMLGKEQVVGFHFAGELVMVPQASAHHYSLQALLESDLLVLPYEQLRAIAVSEPRLLGPMLDACVDALARLRDKAVSLGRKTAPERVADFLQAIQPRLEASGEPGGSIELPMSRRDIADSLGLTIETVSRQFTLLREDGVITTRGRGGVRIVDPAALAARSGRMLRAA